MTRDEEAAIVNRSDPVNGIEEWMCNKCGVKWKEPQSTEVYTNAITKISEVWDRRDDRSGWPVFCDECSHEISENWKKAHPELYP